MPASTDGVSGNREVPEIREEPIGSFEASRSPFSAASDQLTDKEYLKGKHVGGLLNEALEAMLKRRPEDPAHFLQSFFQNKTSGGSKLLPAHEHQVTLSPHVDSDLEGGGGGGGGGGGTVSTTSSGANLHATRRRSSLRRGSMIGSWLTTNADRALSTKTRYDDGINDIKFGAVRGISLADSNQPKIATWEQFLSCVKRVCDYHRLPTETIVDALLDHLRVVDPNEWLSEVEVMSVASLFLYSFETFRTEDQLSSQQASPHTDGTTLSESVSRVPRENTVHRESKMTTPPYWFIPKSRRRLPKPLNERIEALYRSVPDKKNLLVYPLLSRASSTPSGSNRSPALSTTCSPRASHRTLQHPSLASREERLVALMEQVDMIMHLLSSGNSHSIDRQLLEKVCCDLWIAVVEQELPDLKEPTAAAPLPLHHHGPSTVLSLAHFVGVDTITRLTDACQLESQDGTAVETAHLEREAEIVRAYVASATTFEILELLESIMTAEHLPLGSLSLDNDDRHKYGQCVVLVSFRDGSAAISVITPGLKESGIGMTGISRYAVPEALSLRSVMQKCAAAKQFSEAELLLYNTLTDALTYHSGFDNAAPDQGTHVYKVLASFFSTFRYFSAGSVVTSSSPSLATASRARINMVLAGCTTDNPDAPPPIKFELKVRHAIPLGIHSMLPRANEVIIPAGSAFLVEGMMGAGADSEKDEWRVASQNDEGSSSSEEGPDGDTHKMRSTTITLVELESAAALNYHMRHMLKSAPSEQSCSLVWSVLDGRRILKLHPLQHSMENSKDGGLLGFGSNRWVVMMESAEIPLEDFIELYNLEVTVEKWNAIAGPFCEADHLPESADAEVTFTGRFDQILQVNLRTKLGRLTDVDGSQKPLSFKAVRDSRGVVQDADVSFLCSLLKLDPVIFHVSIRGHPLVTEISAEHLLQMLCANTLLRSVQVIQCRVADHTVAAIYALSTTVRRNGKILIAAGAKWQEKVRKELMELLCGITTTSNSTAGPSSMLSEHLPAEHNHCRQQREAAEDLCDPMYALGVALMHTNSMLGALEVSQGGDVSQLFVESAMWEHVRDVSLDNVSVNPEKVERLKNFGSHINSPTSPMVDKSPNRVERDAHLGWSGLRGLTRAKRLRISNLELPMCEDAVNAIAALIRDCKLVTLELDEVQIEAGLFSHLIAAISQSTRFQEFCIEKTDILSAPLHRLSSSVENGAASCACDSDDFTLDEQWAAMSAKLHGSSSLTAFRSQCCTGLPVRFEEQAIRVALRNRLSVEEITKEEHDAIIAELGLDSGCLPIGELEDVPLSAIHK